jgi:hypothetical protein
MSHERANPSGDPTWQAEEEAPRPARKPTVADGRRAQAGWSPTAWRSRVGQEDEQ